MIEIFNRGDINFARTYARSYSPCSRRKYGVMLKHGSEFVGVATNYRVGNYCTDEYCIRTRKRAPHCEMVELGGEIHAEQALLVQYGSEIDEKSHILIAAIGNDGRAFMGWENVPCHVCAMMLKYSGIKYIWFPNETGSEPVSIDEILESYEKDND